MIQIWQLGNNNSIIDCVHTNIIIWKVVLSFYIDLLMIWREELIKSVGLVLFTYRIFKTHFDIEKIIIMNTFLE